MVRSAFIILLVFCLTACDNTSETVAVSAQTSPLAPATSTEPTSRTVSLVNVDTGQSVLNGTYDAATGLFNATINGTAIQGGRFPIADHGIMLAMRDLMGTHNAYVAETDAAAVLVYSGGTPGQITHAASYLRKGATALPLAGSATFLGDYAGFTPTQRVTGAARVDVDFAGNEVSGSITDRRLRSRPLNTVDVVNPLSEIVLERTALRDDGGFAGRTSGGQIVNGQVLWNPASGHFEGLIAGESATTAVGTVTLTHRAPSTATFEEVGGFYTRR